MDFSAKSVWELTKLYVRSPATAAGLAKAANLPITVSVLMIVLAGVGSGVASGIIDALVTSAPVTFELADGSTVEFEQAGPIMQALFGVIAGLALSYAVFAVGARFGGEGSLADILGVMAVLQVIMIVISFIQTLAILISPVMGLAVLMFGLYVFFRGLGHAVNVGHGFDNMGKSFIVIVVSLLVLVVAAMVLAATLGLGPTGEIR